MIINSRKDLEALPKTEQDAFKTRLGETINKWSWDGLAWVLGQVTTDIERFGFTLADFPDAPVPEMPNYDPDKLTLEQTREGASLSRAEFKLGLLNMGELQRVKDFISQTGDDRIVILWEDSANFDRLHPDLLRLANELGYTDAQLDALFGIN